MSLSFTADLHAELLTADGRVPLARRLTVPGEVAEVLELTLPDGTLNLAVVPARVLSGLVVTSDRAIRVCVGDVAKNQPVTLGAGGVFALLGSDVGAVNACALSYTPGDGSTAQVLVLVVAQEYAATGCARFLTHPTLMQQFAHCWDLDEVTGTRMDHIGQAHLTEIGGAVGQISGKVGEAALFTATASLLCSSGFAPVIGPPFTLAFWLYLTEYPVSPVESYCIVGQGNTLNAGGYDLYVIIRNDDQRLQMSCHGGFRGIVTWPTPLTLGVWHLVVAWHTGVGISGGTINMQIDNGVVVSSGGGSNGPTLVALSIGAMGGAGAARMRGRLDTLMHWERALTLQSERDVLWNNGKG